MSYSVCRYLDGAFHNRDIRKSLEEKMVESTNTTIKSQISEHSSTTEVPSGKFPSRVESDDLLTDLEVLDFLDVLRRNKARMSIQNNSAERGDYRKIWR